MTNLLIFIDEACCSYCYLPVVVAEQIHPSSRVYCCVDCRNCDEPYRRSYYVIRNVKVPEKIPNGILDSNTLSTSTKLSK